MKVRCEFYSRVNDSTSSADSADSQAAVQISVTVMIF